MQGIWNHNSPYYRCRFPNEYAIANKLDHPRNVYVREEEFVDPLDKWLAQVFDPDRLPKAAATVLLGECLHDFEPAQGQRVAQPPPRRRAARL